MHEYSRILIEEYCRNHKTAKSKRLSVLVEMSYDLYCEPTDDDGIFLENAIDKEKDQELKEALMELNDFLFPA